jgi:hypothetical protein
MLADIILHIALLRLRSRFFVSAATAQMVQILEE